MGANKESLFPELGQTANSVSTRGVLPSQNIYELIQNGLISAASPVADDQIQPASLDLRLGPVGYRVRASFLPGETSAVSRKVDEFFMHELDLSSPSVLEKGCVYIIPLAEELFLPPHLSAKANPKSTTGRLDIFTRLITDCGTEFERVKAGYKGKLYVEVIPRTFSVLVKEGTKLNQLRFIQGTRPPLTSDSKLDKLHDEETLVFAKDGSPLEPAISQGLRISIDLQGFGSEIVGYRARGHAPLIDLSRVNYYDPVDFWEPVLAKRKSIILNPDDFYILISKEKVRVPPQFAAEMVAYDPSVGEFRIHYAGFFDPGFGYGDDDIKGTRAVLEVRSHEVPFVLEDGQVVGRLMYEPLLSTPDKIYGKAIGSSYQAQGLCLSKQFKPF